MWVQHYHVIKGATLSKDDIKRLQDLLSKKIQDAPEKVKCNCVPGMPMDCR